jgi:hypothetical protein
VTFITFVRNPLYPKGNNASKDEGLWYLTFYVALFLIHSIWEQVPNTPFDGLVQIRWSWIHRLGLSHRCFKGRPLGRDPTTDVGHRFGAWASNPHPWFVIPRPPFTRTPSLKPFYKRTPTFYTKQPAVYLWFVWVSRKLLVLPLCFSVFGTRSREQLKWIINYINWFLIQK